MVGFDHGVVSGRRSVPGKVHLFGLSSPSPVNGKFARSDERVPDLVGVPGKSSVRTRGGPTFDGCRDMPEAVYLVLPFSSEVVPCRGERQLPPCFIPARGRLRPL